MSDQTDKPDTRLTTIAIGDTACTFLRNESADKLSKRVAWTAGIDRAAPPLLSTLQTASFLEFTLILSAHSLHSWSPLEPEQVADLCSRGKVVENPIVVLWMEVVTGRR